MRAALDRGRFDLALTMGKDDTFSAVAKGVFASRALPPLGLLSAGTANDQAKSLKIPEVTEDLEACLDVLEEGHVVGRFEIYVLARLLPVVVKKGFVSP